MCGHKPSHGRQEVGLLVGGRAVRGCPWFLNKFSSVVTAKQTSGNRKSAARISPGDIIAPRELITI
jgi:hypothetical protein